MMEVAGGRRRVGACWMRSQRCEQPLHGSRLVRAAGVPRTPRQRSRRASRGWNRRALGELPALWTAAPRRCARPITGGAARLQIAHAGGAVQQGRGGRITRARARGGRHGARGVHPAHGAMQAAGGPGAGARGGKRTHTPWCRGAGERHTGRAYAHARRAERRATATRARRRPACHQGGGLTCRPPRRAWPQTPPPSGSTPPAP